MKKGVLYKLAHKHSLYRTESCDTGQVALIEASSVVLYLEQSLKKPYTHKVVVQDQVGWIVGYGEWFEELKESYAEPKEQT